MGRAETNQWAFAAGREWFKQVGSRAYPLSGEQAGESMGELSTQFGIDLSDEEVAECFEDGFYYEESQGPEVHEPRVTECSCGCGAMRPGYGTCECGKAIGHD